MRAARCAPQAVRTRRQCGIRFFAGEVSDAYLQRAEIQRGYTIVIWRGRHVAEPTELTGEEATQYWLEVLEAGRRIERVLEPVKVNYDDARELASAPAYARRAAVCGRPAAGLAVSAPGGRAGDVRRGRCCARRGGANPVSALDVFSPETRAWFEGAFAGPTPAQELGWPAIARGGHTLIQAPTGSGKTLAAFLYGIDRLKDTPGEGLRLLYVSPLKALNYDVERNLRGPLAGLNSSLDVAVRTGDTPQKERAAMLRKPPDILITTPESLYLLLTSRARDNLRGVETLILDEVHAVAGTKRGAHLASRSSGSSGWSRSRCSGSACPQPSGRSRRSAGSWRAAARSSWWTPAARRSSTSRSSSPSRTCGSPAAGRSASRTWSTTRR